MRVAPRERDRRGPAVHAEATQRGALVDQLVVVEGVHRDVRGEVAAAVGHRRHLVPASVCRERA